MRIYVTLEDIQGDIIKVTGDELHHMRDVMRLKEGDAVSVFNGEGKEYITRIKTIGKNEAILAVEEVKKSKQLGTRITLAQALPRLSKIDSIIQKATELGVYEIIPMITERTIARPKDSAGKLKRWEKIIVEASKQCRRKSLPKIANVTAFSDIIKKIKDFDMALIFSTGKDNEKLCDLFKNFTKGNVLVLIGPEGDFSPSEESCARAQGCHPVSLGEIILRCETAAVAALSIINYELSAR